MMIMRRAMMIMMIVESLASATKLFFVSIPFGVDFCVGFVVSGQSKMRKLVGTGVQEGVVGGFHVGNGRFSGVTTTIDGVGFCVPSVTSDQSYGLCWGVVMTEGVSGSGRSLVVVEGSCDVTSGWP